MTLQQQLDELVKKENAEPVYSKGSIVGYSFHPIEIGVKFFIDNFGSDLLKAINGSGVFFATAAAQKMYESQFGTSNKAKNYNNYGGITYGSGLKGAIGSKNGFAIFSSPYDCFYCYINNVLKDPSKRYMSVEHFLSATNPKDQILRIAKGGYCESPPNPNDYVRPIYKLIDVVTNMYPTFAKVV